MFLDSTARRELRAADRLLVATAGARRVAGSGSKTVGGIAATPRGSGRCADA